jgi:hypothetical protein
MGYIVRLYTGPLGLTMPDGVRTSRDDSADYASGRPTSSTKAIIYDHLTRSMADSLAYGAKGDVQPLTTPARLSTYTVEGDRLGVHELVQGRVIFRMITGSLTNEERKQMQSNLNQKQRYFYVPKH